MEYDEKSRLATLRHEQSLEKQQRGFQRQDERRQEQFLDRTKAVEVQGENALEIRQFDAHFLPRRNELEIELERGLSEVRIDEHFAIALQNELLAEVAFDRQITTAFLDTAGKLMQQRLSLSDAQAAREHERTLAEIRIKADQNEKERQRQHERELAALANHRAQLDHGRAMQVSQQDQAKAVLEAELQARHAAQSQRHEKEMAGISGAVHRENHFHDKIVDFALWLEMQKRNSFDASEEQIQEWFKEFEKHDKMKGV